jgi:hypothetical protein
MIGSARFSSVNWQFEERIVAEMATGFEAAGTFARGVSGIQPA